MLASGRCRRSTDCPRACLLVAAMLCVVARVFALCSAAAREGNGGAVGFKLGDFGLATLKSGHWRVTEGDSR